LTISGTTGHSSEQEIVNFNDFTNLVGRNERTLSSSGIDSNQYTFLELKSQGCGTLREVSHLWCHLLQMSLELNLILDGGDLKVEAIWSDL